MSCLLPFSALIPQDNAGHLYKIHPVKRLQCQPMHVLNITLFFFTGEILDVKKKEEANCYSWHNSRVPSKAWQRVGIEQQREPAEAAKWNASIIH